MLLNAHNIKVVLTGSLQITEQNIELDWLSAGDVEKLWSRLEHRTWISSNYGIDFNLAIYTVYT